MIDKNYKEKVVALLFFSLKIASTSYSTSDYGFSGYLGSPDDIYIGTIARLTGVI